MVKNIYFIVTEEHFMANYTNLLDHLREFNIPIDIISVPSYNNVGMRDRLFNGKSILKKSKIRLSQSLATRYLTVSLSILMQKDICCLIGNIGCRLWLTVKKFFCNMEYFQ